MDLTFWSHQLGLPEPVYFPAFDFAPYQKTSPHPQISALRMQALWKMEQKKTGVIVLPLQAALHWMAPPESFHRSFFQMEWGEEKGPIEIASILRAYGYREKDLVTSRGEFSLRGGILDVYSPAEELPVRLEFFGNRIESMRSFDTATQRSVKEIEQ